MASRKRFLAAVATLGAAAAAAKSVSAAPPPVAPVPTPVPSPSPKPPKISAAAQAFAERMREFDPGLSDKEVKTIAEGVNYYQSAGSRVNPKGRALKNSDEPTPSFEVRP
ncbi:MAG: hypothetical protein M3Y18_03350 [Candidatus Eremiobacteraeota bacterium]|nr:hypothetical protein [Candidatus Eremiobacteraeota bacterium]